MTDRELLSDLWKASWDEGGWVVPFSKAVADLTPQQAAWKPSPQRKSIWENVNHLCFWQEYLLYRLRGGAERDKAELEAKNFETPVAVEQAAWDATRQRLAVSHQAILDAMGDSSLPLQRLAPLVAHSSYHLGQIMLLRALQGMPALY
jgi:hypothetical protein